MKKNKQFSCYLQVILVVVILLSFIPTARSQTLPKTFNLSLKTAIAMAINNNLDLRVDALDSAVEKSDLKRSKGIYDPRLSFAVNHGQTFYTGETYGTKDTTTSANLTQYLSTGGSLTAATYTGYSKPLSDYPDDDWTDWYTSVGITYVQPLLKNFGKETMELNISVAELSHEESLEEFRDSVIDTVYSVIKNYNRLYTLRQVLESRQRGLDSAQQLLAQLKQKSKPGSKQGIEFANTEYAISQRLKDLVDAERDVSDRAAKLRYLIGMQKKIKIIPVDPPSREEPLENIEQAVSLALEKQPELLQMRLDLQSNQLHERVSKRKLLPNLSVTASTGFRGIEDRFSDSIDQIADGKGRWWSAGLNFSMPIGNTVAESDYQRNKLRTKQLENRIVAAEWELQDKLEEDMRALISARVQRQVADKAFKIAQQRFESYRQSLERKKSTVQNLLDAESDLIYARNNQTEALEDFANAVAKLWKDIGVLLERNNINLNTREPEKLTAGHMSAPVPAPLNTPQVLHRLEEIANLSPSMKNESEVEPLITTTKQETAGILSNKSKNAEKVEPVISQAVIKFSPDQKQSQLNATSSVKEKALYLLKIGTFASSELKVTERKVKAVGLVPQIHTGPKQSREVIRLFGGKFKELAKAQKERDRLLAVKAGAFLLNKGQAGYHLYAGSYFSLTSAQKEQQRLASHGIDLSLKKKSVSLTTSLLTAGHFNSHEAARVGAQKLAELGVKTIIQKVVSQGKKGDEPIPSA
jgi:outer membrane protein